MIQSHPQYDLAVPQPFGVSPTAEKRAYSTIPQETRLDLLRLIEHDQLTIKEAAKRLGINYSTAKHIVKLFRMERRIHTLPKIGRRSRLALSEQHSDAKEDQPKAVRRFVARKTRLGIDAPGCEHLSVAKHFSGSVADRGKAFGGVAVGFNFGVYAQSIVQR